MSRFSQASAGGANDELKKQLKIKSGALKRLSQELKMYAAEKKQVEDKLEALLAVESDAADRKKATELVHESAQVLATTRTNVLAAHETLVAFLVEHAGGAELSGTAELAAAQEIVTKADELLAA